ncbi:PE-PGRS family protein [Pseudofrankia inefficax]|uniref:PE-PGRS family protein n=1 Tax=Pseudofrankia inefficax (strain DSM 45817 / CECT 9037 / DDB 130130 / EuI1c) TaxID=298654 RepID=E3J787_PSEI1|nr:PE-PGRS family protein [Pseudofrankia inefficax]
MGGGVGAERRPLQMDQMDGVVSRGRRRRRRGSNAGLVVNNLHCAHVPSTRSRCTAGVPLARVHSPNAAGNPGSPRPSGRHRGSDSRREFSGRSGRAGAAPAGDRVARGPAVDRSSGGIAPFCRRYLAVPFMARRGPVAHLSGCISRGTDSARWIASRRRRRVRESGSGSGSRSGSVTSQRFGTFGRVRGGGVVPGRGRSRRSCGRCRGRAFRFVNAVVRGPRGSLIRCPQTRCVVAAADGQGAPVRGER